MPFARDAEIYGESEPADYLYKVVSGAIRTYKVLISGRRQIGSFYLPGDIFGLEVGGEHTSSAEAVADSKVLVIRRSAVAALAGRNKEVARQLWTMTAAELQRAQDHMMPLIKTAQERVAGFLCVPKTLSVLIGGGNHLTSAHMIALLCFVLTVLVSPFKSKSRLEAENAALRHQVVVLRRMVHKRVRLTNSDRLFFIQLYRWFPSVLKIIRVIRPETLVRWHRVGFRCYWRWKSRSLGGRPQIEKDLRVLIRRISIENPLWGAPRIHGELLKLGFDVVQSTVAKYMAKRRGPPSLGWRTFLRNHAPDIAAMDLFVVPTMAST